MSDLQNEFEAARTAVIAAGERLALARAALRAAGHDVRARQCVSITAHGDTVETPHAETLLKIAAAGPDGARWTPALHPTKVLALRSAGLVEEVRPDHWAIAPGVSVDRLMAA